MKVVLGFYFDGNYYVVALHEEVYLASGVVGRPIVGVVVA